MEELTRWSKQHPYIQQKELRYLKPILTDLRGYHLAIFGTYMNSVALPSHHLHALTISPEYSTSNSSLIQASYIELPLRNDSIDAAILPYLLNFIDDPLLSLKEIFRSLISNGKLYLFTFQYWHPWCWFNSPKNAKGLSVMQIKQLLQQAEFSINHVTYLHYGAIVAIEAQKNIFCTTPLKPTWQTPQLNPEAVQPTIRSSE